MVSDFVYGVQTGQQRLPSYTAFDTAKPGMRNEARTFFAKGARGYDVMGMSKDQLIADVLVQYERYLALTQHHAAQLVVGAPEHLTEGS